MLGLWNKQYLASKYYICVVVLNLVRRQISEEQIQVQFASYYTIKFAVKSFLWIKIYFAHSNFYKK